MHQTFLTLHLTYFQRLLLFLLILSPLEFYWNFLILSNQYFFLILNFYQFLTLNFKILYAYHEHSLLKLFLVLLIETVKKVNIFKFKFLINFKLFYFWIITYLWFLFLILFRLNWWIISYWFSSCFLNNFSFSWFLFRACNLGFLSLTQIFRCWNKFRNFWFFKLFLIIYLIRIFNFLGFILTKILYLILIKFFYWFKTFIIIAELLLHITIVWLLFIKFIILG